MAHRIELQPLDGFPGRVVPYARWQELHAALEPLVRGRTLAMEISPDDAVPYLDRVPFGVVELLRRLGATVVPSGPLVSRFAARWNAREIGRAHRGAAEAIAAIARRELSRTVREIGVTERAVQARVMRASTTPSSSSTIRLSWRSGPGAPSRTTRAARPRSRRARWC